MNYVYYISYIIIYHIYISTIYIADNCTFKKIVIVLMNITLILLNFDRNSEEEKMYFKRAVSS